MNNFEILKQEIQSWYPDYTFLYEELNGAVRDLIKFFATNAIHIRSKKIKAYKAQNSR